jgi:hypothetical protein
MAKGKVLEAARSGRWPQLVLSVRPFMHRQPPVSCGRAPWRPVQFDMIWESACLANHALRVAGPVSMHVSNATWSGSPELFQIQLPKQI